MEERRSATEGRNIRGERDPVEDGVAKDSETKRVALAIVDEAIDRFSSSFKTIAVAELGVHGSGDIDTELDVGHFTGGAGLLEFARSGEEDNAKDQNEGW